MMLFVFGCKQQVRHLETCINEGDAKLHTELSKLVKENEKLKEDKESTEGAVGTAQDQLAQAQRENGALRDQLSTAHDELRYVRQKSKEEVADLEYKVEQLLATKQSLIVETTTLHASVAELESACKTSISLIDEPEFTFCFHIQAEGIWKTSAKCDRPLPITRYVWRMPWLGATRWNGCWSRSGPNGKPNKKSGSNSRRIS